MRHGRPGAWRKLRRSAWEAATPRGVPGLRKTCLSGSRREPPPFLASRGPMQPGAVEGTEAAMTGAHGWSGVTARSVRSTIRHSTPGPESLPGCRPCTLLPSPARRGASRRRSPATLMPTPAVGAGGGGAPWLPGCSAAAPSGLPTIPAGQSSACLGRQGPYSAGNPENGRKRMQVPVDGPQAAKDLR
jgi:hypothetical protein